jgi:hypothetical protein
VNLYLMGQVAAGHGFKVFLCPLDCVTYGPDIQPTEEHPEKSGGKHGCQVNRMAEPGAEMEEKDTDGITGAKEYQPELDRKIEIVVDDTGHFHGDLLESRA